MAIKRKKVLLIENLSSDFYKARLPLAKYLIKNGWEVYALIPNDKYLQLIRNEGIQVIGYDLIRKNKGISQIVNLILIYKKIIKEYDFDVVHSFRFQPNLISALANFFSKRKIILHITGLGIAFSNTSIKFVFFRFISQLIFQMKLLTADKVVVQNPDDGHDLWLSSFWKKKITLVKGSGVNTSLFNKDLYNKSDLRKLLNISEDNIVFTCITRLIWEKGIEELTEAFESIVKQNSNVILLLIGWSDKENPRHIPDSYFEKYKNNKNLLFLGKRNDVKEILSISDVFIYPSYYREGIPRSLLEAMSMSLPIITTDMPGCNLTIENGANGYLIEKKSKIAIEKTVLKCFDNKSKLKEMGNRSRKIVSEQFEESIVFFEIEKLYY
jgi:glycosyltransferase involved in cell wall biosynthesis